MSQNLSSRRWPARRLTYLAMFMALSAVGAYIKIPSIIGTPALDSFPGFLAALLMGPVNGAIVAALGHMLTALTAGFPLSIPIHLLIAGGMAGIAALFAVVSRYSLWAGMAAGAVLNGIALNGLFLPIPGFGKAFFLAMVVPLTVASILNIALAGVVFKTLNRLFPNSYIKTGREKAGAAINNSHY